MRSSARSKFIWQVRCAAFQRHLLTRPYSSTAPPDRPPKSDHATQVTEPYGYTRRREDAWPSDDLAVLPAHLRPDKAETLDLILRQNVYLLQARRGYRANTDSFVLPYFASHILASKRRLNCTSTARVLELGAGTGLVSILFARANSPVDVHLVELQGQLVQRAIRNLQLNDVTGHVYHHDLKGGCLPQVLHRAFDVVLINPPFHPIGSRIPPKHRERYLAHMETSASLSDFIAAARTACDADNPDASVAIIHDIRELPRLRAAVDQHGFIIHACTEMKHRETDEPTRILLHLQLQSHHSPRKPSLKSHSRIPPPVEANTICLHSNSEPQSIYTNSIEQFLADLPPPSLRIGRLRDT